MFCEVRIFFARFFLLCAYALVCCSEKINPDIAKMLALSVVVSEKAAIPKRKKNLELSQLVQYKKGGKPSKSLHNKIEGMIKVFDFIC